MAEETYVYRYTCPISLQPFYIGLGKTHGRYNRALSHLKRTDMHPMVYKIKSLREKGMEPLIDFICVNVDKEFAGLVEQEAIAKYGRRDLGTGSLFNMTDGADGIQNLSIESRINLGKKISAGKKGKKFTPEHIAALKICSRKPVSLETCDKLSEQMTRVWAERKANNNVG